MIVTAMLFGAGFRVAGGELSSMLDSGGMREQMMDLADDRDMRFAEISARTVEVMRAHLQTHFPRLYALRGADKTADRVRRVEVRNETTYVRHHKKKIL